MNATPDLRQAAEALQRGAFAAAQAVCEAVLTTAPNDVQALYLLGSALLGQGRSQDAEAALERARRADPKNVFVLQGLGGAYNANGKRDEAVAVLREAVDLAPNFGLGHLSLALAYTRLGERARAKLHFETALKLDPKAPRALLGLARIASAEDRDAEALELAERALAIAPNLLGARLVKAEMALRQRGYEEVLQQLAAISGLESASPDDRVSYCYLRAQACEALGQSSEAFNAYRTAGEIQRDRFRAEMEHVENISGFSTIAALRTFSAKVDASRWRHPRLDRAAPVFFVGYPRSGTTLLDQVIASHPDIQTLEESQNFTESYRQLIQAPGALGRWSDLSEAEIRKYREAYWREAEAALGGPPSRKVFVDKMPLNSVLLPLMQRLFPGAKVIFALRDPRDVVLSCFTQRFSMNPAMYNFLSIDTAAQHYGAVMDLVALSRQRFPLKFHDVRYEDLVANFDKTVAAVLSFLDLPWNDKVRDYAATAMARQVNTPSAPDVRLPLYRNSIQRWRKYANVSEAAAAFSTLAPWVKAYGYAPS